MLARIGADEHTDELIKMCHNPGKARRETPTSEIVVPDEALSLAGPYGPPTGIDPVRVDAAEGDAVTVTVSAEGADGTVHIDAVHLMPVPATNQ